MVIEVRIVGVWGQNMIEKSLGEFFGMLGICFILVWIEGYIGGYIVYIYEVDI